MRELAIDAPLDDSEWKHFVHAKSFGELVTWSVDGAAPVVVPLHFTFDGR